MPQTTDGPCPDCQTPAGSDDGYTCPKHRWWKEKEPLTTTFAEKLAEVVKTTKFYDPSKRPVGSNADEWHVFIEEHHDRKEFLAVQIAEALDAAEKRYLSAVKGRQEFRKAYRESRITEDYNDSLDDVDKFNRETGGGVW